MRSGGFSPASLFAGGIAGAWYGPSDLSTLFQDSAGTTPVTTTGQPVGLMLDKSKGLVLGPEVVTNGGGPFTSTTGYSAVGSATISIDTGRLKVVQTVGFTEGVFYLLPDNTFSNRTVISFDVDLGSSTLVQVQAGNGNFGNGGIVTQNITSSGTYNIITTVLRNGGSGITFKAGSATNFFLSRISIRELPGNHATQATAGLTSRYQVSPFGSEYDGNDDFSAQPFKPTLAGTIAVRMRSDTASRVAFGSQPASNGRCYIGLASDGSLAGGIGEQATSVIKGSADIRGDLVTGILTWDGTTVSLYQDGVSVYSAAQLGAVNTTVAMHEGALNNNGTAAAFHKGRIAQSIVLDRVMTAAEIASLTNLWSTIS